MKKVRGLVEKNWFQNFILIIIVINSIIMGLQTSKVVNNSIGDLLVLLDNICLCIFIIEIMLKLMAYGLKFFLNGWNIFDFVIVFISLLSGLAFLSVLRSFRIFRVFRTLKSLKALKGMKSLRVISGFKHLRIIVEAIGKSIPGIFWSAVLMLLIYYMFALMGTMLFGEDFTDWFGTMGASMYTLFQVMTLESWSMGISRPVMEVYGWAWIYFVPFVLITSFLIMNVVVGIVVNAISEVSAFEIKEDIKESAAEGKSERAQLKEELAALKEQISKIEALVSVQDEDY